MGPLQGRLQRGGEVTGSHGFRPDERASGKESIDTSTPTGKLMLTFLAGIAEFEREMIKERQREGIQLAKQQGKYQGRKRITIDNLQELKERWEHREISKAEISRQLHISPDTIDRRFKELDAPRELEQRIQRLENN